MSETKGEEEEYYSFVAEEEDGEVQKTEITSLKTEDLNDEEEDEEEQIKEEDSAKESKTEEESEEEDVREWLQEHIDTVFAVRSSEVDSKRFELQVNRAELSTSLLNKDVQLLKQLRGITTECGNLREEVGWMEQDLSDVKETMHRNILNIHVKAAKDKRTLLDEIDEMLLTKKQLEQSLLEQRKYINYQKEATSESQQQQNQQLDAQIDKISKQIDTYRFGLSRGVQKFDEQMSDARDTIDMLEFEIHELDKQIKSLDTQYVQAKDDLEKVTKKLEKAENLAQEMKEELDQVKQRRLELQEELDSKDAEQWKQRVSQLNLKK